MAQDHIRYDILTQEALRGVVRKVLAEVARTGLPGEHHFFISFITKAPGVRVSQRLLEQYPNDMTIVLQNRFWDLIVDEERFSVGLSFNQVPSKLVIPYAAITGFHDPAVNFELRFQVQDADPPEPHDDAENDGPVAEPIEDGSNVVAVDFKRKK